VDEKLLENLRDFGWQSISVSDALPAFLYTVGLTQTLRHPEFIIFGLEPETAHSIISAAVNSVRAGHTFTATGQSTIELKDGPLAIAYRRVHGSQHPLYLGEAMSFVRQLEYAGDLEVTQIFWPDISGKFPFEANCDWAVYESQPRLDVPLTRREIEEFEKRWR
jgi:hypothetical protein